jgi:phosphate:Na+ symporter
MNWTEVIFQTVGGLGLFLMGMKIMSETMQKVAGERLRKTLNFLTSNRFMAIGIGFLVTAIIQSSSATTVMVVGFVNAGLMSLVRAIGVILGANVGTTVTGWIITLKVVKYALPLIGLGVFIRFFSKSTRWRYYGEITFGFGLLFLGMQTMKAGFAPLRHSQEFIAFFTRVDGSGYLTILMGVIIGALTTLIVQSSSATIGITIALASQGLLNYEGAVSLILGENIGTTITAILASIGGNFHAKRAAVAHTLFNVLGVVVVLILFFPFVSLVERLVPGIADMSIQTAQEAARFSGAAIGTKPFIGKHIAMAHTLFNITNVIVFTALVPLLAKLCRIIIPDPKIPKSQFRSIEFSHITSKAIGTSVLGIVETRKKLVLMAKKVAQSSLIIQDILNTKTGYKEMCDRVLKTEKTIDECQKYITELLVSLSTGNVSDDDAIHIGNYMTLAHNLEKYADHLEHMALIYDKMDRQRLVLSDEARYNVKETFKEISNFFNVSFNVLNDDVNGHSFMEKAQVINRRVKKLIKSSKLDHFNRIRKKVCRSEVAIYFVDLLNHLDGMRSQAYNIAEITTGSKYKTIDN